MGVYAQHAPAFANAGLPVFPVDTRHKRPSMLHWQRVTPATSRRLAANERLGGADGVGLLMGKASGITEVDVDAAGDAWIGAAIERFGDTPVVIRTASGKAKLWYRHTGERRMIRPFDGMPIDVLGSGFTIAPPSYRADLGTSYKFIRGGIANTDALPTIKPGALDWAGGVDPDAVLPGGRNNHLWRWGMTIARRCDDLHSLVDAMASHADAFAEPLPASEIERCAKSAWRYESEGRNFVGLKRPQIKELDRTMDALADEPAALALLLFLDRWHSNRPSFRLSPTAMSEKGALAAWSKERVQRARDILLERGYLIEVSPPDAKRRKAGVYRLQKRRI